MDFKWDILSNLLIYYGIRVIAAVVIFFIGKWVAGVVSNLIEKIMLKSRAEKTLAIFVKKISYIGILIFVVVAALGKLGLETASIIAVLGAAGLAIGLALQNSLSNFAAGVLIVLFRPFKVGDLVEIGGVLGTVSDIHIFTTEIMSIDNKKCIIPNSKITTDTITNFSDVDKRRIDMVFGISYDDNIKTAKSVLLNLLENDERVLKNPKPVVAVGELADSSVNLVCRPWVKPDDYWNVYFDVLEKGKEALESSGITIPFPQTDVHLYKKDI